MTIFKRLQLAFKALTINFPSGSSWSLISLGRTRYDYAGQVGDGRGNSAVEAVVRWVGRTFPEAPVQVLQTKVDGTETPIVGHPLLDLLARPNPYYSGELLWRATLADWASDGNSYWIKRRNGLRAPVELWWAPSWTMAPVWPQDDPTVFISHYEYTVDGNKQSFAVEDVVHFRDGLDSSNTRKGLSPIKALAREIFTDDEAANMTASLLKNMGVPGVIISPDGEEVDISKADADAVKADFKQRFGGDNRGEPMVMPARTKVSVLSWSPEQMNMRELRRIPEERICAMLGVPAIVVGLGAGLDRSTYSNMAEAREAAYESFIIPNQRLFGADLKSQLLRDYGDTKALRVGFDTSNVRVLQEDENKRWTRVDTAVRGGWLKVSRAKEMVGEKPEDGDDVYLRSSSITPVGPDAPEPEPLPIAPSADSGLPDAGAGESAPDRSPVPGAKGVSGGNTSYLTDPVETKGRAPQIVRTFERSALRLSARFANDLDEYFEGLGGRVKVTFIDEKSAKAANSDEWEVIRELWLDGQIVQVEIPKTVGPEFQKLYEAAFRLILETTVGIVEQALDVPIGVNLPDYRAREIIRNWSTRKGLVDLNAQTRDAVMKALEEGRAAGDGAEALARRIRGMVEGRGMYPGVYREAYERAKERGWGEAAASRAGDRAARQYRAETIARTETKTAQNRSSIEAYRASEVVEALKVWDGDDCGWTGHDDTDKADGKIVSFEEADAYPLAHPRCVRSFGPVVKKTVE